MSVRFNDVATAAVARRWTIVPALDEATLHFCRTIAPSAPASVPIVVEGAAKPLRCFWNVRDKVRRDSGGSVFGWAVFAFPGAYWEAQHHAVWESPNESLVDVTPPVYDDLTSTLFVRDDAASVDCGSNFPLLLPMRRSGLPMPEVRSYMAFKLRIENAKAMLLPGQSERDDWNMQRLRRAEAAAKRNMLLAIANASDDRAPCFCRSGRNFADCCVCHFS